jgi:hypothetical protein
LNVNVAATTIYMYIAFAGGFGSSGSVDYTGSISADTTITLGASNTYYIYADRNVSTGAITLNSTLLAPNYGYGITKSVTNLQHTYEINEGVMYVGNGATATAVQRVFIGEAVTGASTVTSTTTYALMGKYTSAFAAMPANGSSTNFNHNIGYAGPEMKYKAVAKCVSTGEQGIVVGEIFDFMGITSSTNVSFNPVSITSRNTTSSVKSNAGSYQWVNYRRSGTIGEIFTPTEAYYNYAVIVDRGW